jgi:hypothetical protein
MMERPKMEIAKLIVSFLTPLTIALVGLLVQRTLAAQSRTWKVEDRLADKRVEIYEKIGVDLNRIYCYVMDVGDFKDEIPDEIIAAKRNVDRNMFIYQAIWPEETFKCFQEYIDSAFLHSKGERGSDAKIRAQVPEKKAARENRGKKWPAAWDERFTGERDASHKTKYAQLMKLISRDLIYTAHNGEGRS